MPLPTQRERIRPPALRAGDTLGVIAPAGPISPDALTAGLAALERRGYRPLHLPSILERDWYFAGSVRRRVDELHRMFADPEVKGIVCFRGGYGCNYLLPHLDLELIRRHPKFFCGCSDVTTLLTYLCDTAGMVVFHGPMLQRDAQPDGVDEDSWYAATSGEPYAHEFGEHGPDLGARTRRRHAVRRLPVAAVRLAGYALRNPDAPARFCSWKTSPSRPIASTAC